METTASIAQKRKFLLSSSLLTSLCYKFWKGSKPIENEAVIDIFVGDILRRRKEPYRVVYKLEDFRNPRIRKLATGLLLFYWYRRCCGGWARSGLVHPSFRFEIIKTRKAQRTLQGPKRYASGSMIVEEFMKEMLSEIVDPSYNVLRTDDTIGGTDYSLYDTSTQTWIASFQVKEYVFCYPGYGDKDDGDVFGEKVSAVYLEKLATRLKRKYPDQKFFLLTPEIWVYGKRGYNLLRKLERKWDGIAYLWLVDEKKDNNTVKVTLHHLNRLAKL